MKKEMVFAVIAVIVIASSFLFIINRSYNTGLVMEIPHQEEVHEHADFKVFLDGKEHNFSKAKYMSDGNNILSQQIHLHDLDGEVIHKHAKGVVLGQFFETLNMKINSTCFILDSKIQYCDNKDKKMKIYVNGILNDEFERYELKDLDRILISYGDENQNELKNQIDGVTDKSCIQSGKCPERGLPTLEASCSNNGICTVE